MTLNASKAGLLEETRQFILAYGATRDVGQARQRLLVEVLPQRSRDTRATIVQLIGQRLVRWRPPGWVWDDLVAFAQASPDDSLRAALLLHVTRQDALLYDFVQQVVVRRWHSGERNVSRADVQRFLDLAQATQPEINAWSHATREKLAGNSLSILRDYGLLTGTARKHIVEPLVPEPVAHHLARLLRAEGVAEDELPRHPDWRVWLWDAQRIRNALATLHG